MEMRPPPVTRLRPDPHLPAVAEQEAFSAACPTRQSRYMPAGQLKHDYR